MVSLSRQKNYRTTLAGKPSFQFNQQTLSTQEEELFRMVVNNNDSSIELEPCKSDAGKKTPSRPRTISKSIFVSIALGGVAMTAIFCGFDGLIEIKLGLEGGQVLIDGRKPPLLPPITDNSSNTD